MVWRSIGGDGMHVRGSCSFSLSTPHHGFAKVYAERLPDNNDEQDIDMSLPPSYPEAD